MALDHDVLRFRDNNGDGNLETRESIVSRFGNGDSYHRVSGMTIGPDGWLYPVDGR